MKRTLAILLTLVLMMSVLPMGLFTVTTSAATSGTTGDCTWTLNGTVLTISGNGAMADYDYYNYKTAPWGRYITSIVIEDGVTNVGDSAFTWCSELTEVSIPNSVTKIGFYSFFSCISLEDILIPNSVKIMGSHAFGNCESIVTITIPEGVTTIDFAMFSDCESLVSVDIPDTVTIIGGWAFSNCPSLKTVYYGGTEAQWNAISIGDYNDPLLNADIKFCHSYEMVKEGSIRREGVDKNGKYQSAGIRFKSRLSKEMHEGATEIGFIAVPTQFLNGMTLDEYSKTEGNVCITAKVKAEGMKDIIYATNTDENGRTYYDYQMVITGLTREGVSQNMLDTEITTLMYVVIDGETIYTDTMAYSYNDIAALMK